MSCIITYKGQKYSEEKFKKYFINNKQEFATSIAKNKDVIDSFKRKMEGIDFVFSQSSELASIGNKVQYLQYLSTIFKTRKVKDIVYRGSKEEDIRLFQYWTNNRTEAYMYAKANITKSGKITERNPLSSIKKVAEDYFDTKYGKNTYNIISLTEKDLEPEDWMMDFDTEGNLFIKDTYLKALEQVKKDYSTQPFILNKLSEKDKELIKNIKIVFDLYDYVKIESESDLMKQYDDTNYISNIDNYNKARKYIDDNLDFKKIREGIGKITTAILNIKNPYTEEIVQEDLQNDKDAYRNGHDGAFLMDGNHFLVKSNTEQIHILGSKQDIDGFKEFVDKDSSTKNELYSQAQEISDEEALERIKKCK